MFRLNHILLAILLLALSVQVSATKPSDPCMRAGVRNSVVFLGTFIPSKDPKINPEAKYLATAFLLEIDKRFYIVTASHVITEFAAAAQPGMELVAFVNDSQGKRTFVSLANLQTTFKTTWITSDSSDLAIMPFGLKPEFAVQIVPESLFLSSGSLEELQDVFFMSFQPGVQRTDRITPVIRKGMVSALNEDGSFYIDAFAFPGNSGSPVFIKALPMTSPEPGVLVAGDPNGCRLAGVVGEYLTYQETAVSEQTKRPRVVFEENTGLARVWSVDALRALIASPEFHAQHEKLKAAGQ